MNLFREKIDDTKYFIVNYYVESQTNLKNSAWNIAIGQSIGNPNIRNDWETDELIENHSCKILGNENDLQKLKSGFINIAFPLININFNEDGISQLLCQIMGGQLDIDDFDVCQVKDIIFPENFIRKYFLPPKFGITGIRNYTSVYNKPLLGGIIKPKIGMTPEILLKMVKELVNGGVNFIKEDEIMSNPNICPIEKRVPLIMDYIKNKGVIYSVCINSDTSYVLERVKKVYELGGNSVHVNFWSGLGVYNSIRKLDIPIFLFFQKSGDKILTDKSHRFHIDWDVICKLAGIMGVDFIHAGMWNGYSSYEKSELESSLKILRNYNVMPSLSCGMHPGLIDSINKNFGIDYMANVGGAIHGHPDGTISGVKAMRQSIDYNFGNEYFTAIKKWGKL